MDNFRNIKSLFYKEIENSRNSIENFQIEDIFLSEKENSIFLIIYDSRKEVCFWSIYNVIIGDFVKYKASQYENIVSKLPDIATIKLDKDNFIEKRKKLKETENFANQYLNEYIFPKDYIKYLNQLRQETLDDCAWDIYTFFIGDSKQKEIIKNDRSLKSGKIVTNDYVTKNMSMYNQIFDKSGKRNNKTLIVMALIASLLGFASSYFLVWR